MATRVERHTEFLSADDVVDVRRDLEGNRMTGFSLNLRSFIDGRWVDVARFDTDHGRLHVHHLGLLHSRDLERGPVPFDRTAQYDRCRRRLRRDWQAWRARAEVEG